jgi:hypothetical protein
MISKASVTRLREIFLGQEVVVYLREMNVVTVNEEGQEISISAMTTGHVIEVDESFYYLGTPDGEVTRTISHDVAQMVEIAIQSGLELDFPTEEDEVH